MIEFIHTVITPIVILCAVILFCVFHSQIFSFLGTVGTIIGIIIFTIYAIPAFYVCIIAWEAKRSSLPIIQKHIMKGEHYKAHSSIFSLIYHGYTKNVLETERISTLYPLLSCLSRIERAFPDEEDRIKAINKFQRYIYRYYVSSG